MKYELEALRAAGLTNLEAGQLIKRHLSDIATLDKELIVDEPLTNYLDGLTTAEATYEKALVQVQMNEESKKIQVADINRDKSISVITSAISLHSKSDDAEEIEAARSLTILINTYKDLANLSYEAESMGLDRLVSDLESEAYKPKVDLLGMGRYVTRAKDANDAFKTLFGNRLVAEASTITYNAKLLRKELFAQYGEATQYIVSMANAHKTPQFLQVLALINEARKYYAGLLARRAGVKDKENEAEVKSASVN